MLSKYWALSCKGIGSTVDADTFMVLFDDLGKQHDVRFDGTIKRGTLGTIAEFVLDGKKMIAKTVPAVDWCMENLRKEYAILSFLYGNAVDI